MTPKSELIALAAVVEAAKKGTRGLSCMVSKAIGWRPCDGGPGSGTSSPWAWGPDFTEVLDAAVSLVPEYSLYTVRTLWDRDKVAGFASVSRYEQAGEAEPLLRYWMNEHQSNASTPALALCAAALRARAFA